MAQKLLLWLESGMMMVLYFRIWIGLCFEQNFRIRILLKFFGADQIIKFQYPHNTDLYPKTAWECFVLHNTHFCTVLWNLSYIFHMHTFKQALVNTLCFECFVIYHKFVHIKAIDIFWSNSLIGRLCALISLLRFYKSDPFKFFRTLPTSASRAMWWSCDRLSPR